MPFVTVKRPFAARRRPNAPCHDIFSVCKRPRANLHEALIWFLVMGSEKGTKYGNMSINFRIYCIKCIKNMRFVLVFLTAILQL